MDESEDNLSADDTKTEQTPTSFKPKPKKKSLVERELETSLTPQFTSPMPNGDVCNTSRYGRALRLKTDSDFIDSDKLTVRPIRLPAIEKTPAKLQSPPVHKMHASNSPIKGESLKKTPNMIAEEESNLENCIENIYSENNSLSCFGSTEKRKISPGNIPKLYVRKDLIQKKEKEETVTLIKNMFSPRSGQKRSNSHLQNVLQRSSEKYSLNTSVKKSGSSNALVNNSSVVKTLDFDGNKRKRESSKIILSKSELFDLEAKCEYQVGDLAWARMGTFPFWPCIVTREPSSGMFVRKKLFGRIERDIIHVTFFGDNGRRSWIVNTMLRKFLGQLEFEATREHFSPTAKKRDPRLYAAFFVSEKKMPLWSISVEEAETLLREPKRLRIDIFYDMLAKSRSLKIAKQKSGKVARTNSNVSLSESLYDTLFSDNDGIIEDSDGSRSKTRKSLDVSEVVTACLDNMAAKSGMTKIQRQSHMDRWLQKAKSKTPEKSQVKLQVPPKEKERVISTKKKRWEAPRNVPIIKPYSLRKSYESQNLMSHQSEEESTTLQESEIPGLTFGIITKVESLRDQEDVIDTTTPQVDTVENNDTTCESPTFTQDYDDLIFAHQVENANAIDNTDVSVNTDAISNSINSINMNDTDVSEKTEAISDSTNSKNMSIDEGTKNNTHEITQEVTIIERPLVSLENKSNEKSIEISNNHDIPSNQNDNSSTYLHMNGHLENNDTDIENNSHKACDSLHNLNKIDDAELKMDTVSPNSVKDSDVSILDSSTSHCNGYDIDVSIERTDTDTSFDNLSQVLEDKKTNCRFVKPVVQPRTVRKRSLRLKNRIKSKAKSRINKTEDDGFEKYVELRRDALMDENPKLSYEEIMEYLLKTWQYEQGDTLNDKQNVICNKKSIEKLKIDSTNDKLNKAQKKVWTVSLTDILLQKDIRVAFKNGEKRCVLPDIANCVSFSKAKPEIKPSNNFPRKSVLHNNNDLENHDRINCDNLQSKLPLGLTEDHRNDTSNNQIKSDIKDMNSNTDIVLNVTLESDVGVHKNYKSANILEIDNDRQDPKTISAIPYQEIQNTMTESEDNLNLTLHHNSLDSDSHNVTKQIIVDIQTNSTNNNAVHTMKNTVMDVEILYNSSLDSKSKNDRKETTDIIKTNVTNNSESVSFDTIDSKNDDQSINDLDQHTVKSNESTLEKLIIKDANAKISKTQASQANKETDSEDFNKFVLESCVPLSVNELQNKHEKQYLDSNDVEVYSVLKSIDSIVNDETSPTDSLDSELENNKCLESPQAVHDKKDNDDKEVCEKEETTKMVELEKTDSSLHVSLSPVPVMPQAIHDHTEVGENQEVTKMVELANVEDLSIDVSLAAHSMLQAQANEEAVRDHKEVGENKESTKMMELDESELSLGVSLPAQSMPQALRDHKEVSQKEETTKSIELGKGKDLSISLSAQSIPQAILNHDKVGESGEISKMVELDKGEDLLLDVSLSAPSVLRAELSDNKKDSENEKTTIILELEKSGDLSKNVKLSVQSVPRDDDIKEVSENEEITKMAEVENNEGSSKDVSLSAQCVPNYDNTIIEKMEVDEPKCRNNVTMPENISTVGDKTSETQEIRPQKEIQPSVVLNGFHSADDYTPDISDVEFNAETSSINSEDSEPLSKVKSKLLSKNRQKTSKDRNDPDFLKYLEMRQDALMDEHPELDQEQIIEYMYKAWLYEENTKSDYMKTDDIEQTGLVKGLNDDLRQKSIRNSFRANKKRKSKPICEDSISISSDTSDFSVRRKLRQRRIHSPAIIMENNDSKDISPERKLRDENDDSKSVDSDSTDISTKITNLNKKDTESAILDETSPENDTCLNEKMVSSETFLHDIAGKECETKKYFDMFNPSQSKSKNRDIKAESEIKVKEENDPDAVSINSEDSEISLSKRKQRKCADRQPTKDDPEFLKYLELRQDAIIDEHPELSEEEIVSYLFKTWLYEESMKSDIKKSDEIEQANLVKGLNTDIQPSKKEKKKIKAEKDVVVNEDLIQKDKPKRKTSHPYYIEDDLSDSEDLEVFDIFKSKQKLTTTGETHEIVEAVDDDVVDVVELYFSEMVKPKPNVFKGVVREKVCEICERTSNLVKCKGCNSMFHADCVKNENEVKVETPALARGRKKKKKYRRIKNLDESGSHSDEKSQEHSEDNNVSVEDILEPETYTVDAENFESLLEVKMKELISTEANYDTSFNDCGITWNGAIAGKCEIVDVKLQAKFGLDYSDFKCNNCLKYEIPVCFVCKQATSKSGVDYRQRCQTAQCNRYYHMECLDHWPQTQFHSKSGSKINERFEEFMCPRHVCHTCVSDDPRGCKTRFSGDKLARCVRCPATYHSFTKCLPAGSQILTASHIVCPRHCEHRPGKIPCHVNTGWCFICALGGSLICCEYCPTSFHAECLNIKPPEGGYMCEDCETGRLPLYGEMVWVKLGNYRWWPGLILHPSEIPDNIMAVKHSPGEFVVRFFGQYDHYWVNRGRVFPFQEGDSGKISSQKSKIDAAFTMAMEHAQRACEIMKTAVINEEEDTDIASSLLPPHYVKLKVNKPVGSVVSRRVDVDESSLTQCDCDPLEEDPCGPYSHCLNRMLLTECGPSCRAGDRCNNRAFEKRLYPRMAPYKTPHRGWGLRTLEDIRAGQFVIEYVGELIDEEEFRRRMNRKHEIRDENFYFLTLDKERMIDAGPKGNLARFMNHCCEPNCETQKWTVLGDVRVGLFAINDIPANSELTFNYNLECVGIEKKRCLCGAKRCSGYMGAKPKQDEQPKKTKRVYKKRKNAENSPSTSKNKPKRPVGRPAKPKELTEIEKDLLIIKSATNGLSSDSETSSRLSSMESEKNTKALKRKRVSFSTEGDSNAKKVKLEDEKPLEVGD